LEFQFKVSGVFEADLKACLSLQQQIHDLEAINGTISPFIQITSTSDLQFLTTMTEKYQTRLVSVSA
jgi:hypothetical protein